MDAVGPKRFAKPNAQNRNDTGATAKWTDIWYIPLVYLPAAPHQAVPEVSKSKVHVNQEKNAPIGIDCDLLNTFHSISTAHSISHATLFWWWPQPRSTKHYSVLQKYYSVLQSTTLYYKVLLCTKKYQKFYKVLLRTKYHKLQTTTHLCKVLQVTTPYKKLQTTNDYSELQTTSPVLHYKVLLNTTKYYLGNTGYFKVLLRTTKYSSDSIPSDKVPRRTKIQIQFPYYSIVHSTTPYYKVVLRYYSILQTKYNKKYTKYCRVLPAYMPVW